MPVNLLQPQYMMIVIALLAVLALLLVVIVLVLVSRRNRLAKELASVTDELADRTGREANAELVDAYRTVVEDTAADNRRLRKHNEIIQQSMDRVQRQSDYIRDFSHRFRHDSVGRFELLKTVLEHASDNHDRNEIDHALSQIEFMNESLRLHLAPDISRHVADQVEARRERFNLNRRIESLIDTFREHNPAITLERPEEEIELWGNWYHMELLISNLVSNAINHGRANGKIQISLQRNGSNAVLSVYNEYPPDGEELQESELEQLFELGVTRRATDGRGYGLYFVNQVAEGYGGEVVFENVETVTRSAFNKSTQNGVKFVVNIPAIPEPAEGVDA